MTVNKFEAAEGLLDDVMRKQAGSVEKALLEAVMNSVDAGASTVSVSIEEDSVQVVDDGKGMERDEIDEYFRKFGLKDDDIEGKEFGKFRMGRGQIFSFGKNVWHTKDNVMVVNLDEETTEFTDPSTGLKDTVETPGLSYYTGTTDESFNGCSISVDLYRNLDNLSSTASEFKKLVRFIPWVHDIELVVKVGDDEPVEMDEEFDYDHETDEAWFSINTGGYSRLTDIYNKGAFVDSKIMNNTGGVIITKGDLDVNFARKDILDTDENWPGIKKEYSLLTAKELIRDIKDPSHSGTGKSEKAWLIEESADNSKIEDMIKDMDIIEDISGNKLSMSFISGRRVAFAQSGDKLAQSAMEQTNVIVIDRSYESALKSVMGEQKRVSLTNVVDEEMRWEMDEVSHDSLKSKQRTNLERAEYLLEEVGYPGPVKPGNSMHYDVWKDGDGVLFIDRSLLHKNKDEFITSGLIEIIEVAAVDDDTRDGVEHSYSSLERFKNYAKRMGEAQLDLLNNKAP